MPRSLSFSLRRLDPSSVPAPPGGRLVDAIVFELIAQECGGGGVGELPAEINLGIRYTDADASGLNEQNFTIAILDQSTRQWQPAAKQAPDPGANYVSATITRLGTYAVYQR
jgi:hypothetical protein